MFHFGQISKKNLKSFYENYIYLVDKNLENIVESYPSGASRKKSTKIKQFNKLPKRILNEMFFTVEIVFIRIKVYFVLKTLYS